MTKTGNGKVWLVGAGPSDAGLLTLKGKHVLEQADVVVYDNLVGQGILGMIPKHVKGIFVGKVAGNHPVPQDQINQLLLREAQHGNKVVRLKGGDPFLFGRGGEELELLSQHNIPFEIVPGISSAIAVPAYGGIPVTHRDYCSSLHIITGHTKKKEEADIDYEALVKLDGTLVFLMGVTAMKKICQGLLNAGMKADTPAAVLERGTTAHQRRVLSDVSNLWADADAAKIKAPAVIVIGAVCNLSETFHWAEDRPLGRLKVAVTRPADRSSFLAVKLEEQGAEVVRLPAIETNRIPNNPLLQKALKDIDDYTWLVFTSVAGVKAFFLEMWEQKIDVRALSQLKIAAIGTVTRRAIEEKGIFVDLVPKVYHGAALGEALAQVVTAADKVLIPRAKQGTEAVCRPLEEADIPFDDIPVYDTKEGMDERAGVYDETIDYVAFTSASTVRGFVKMNPGVEFSQVNALCIGEQTAAEASKYKMNLLISEEATIDSMVRCLIEKEAEQCG